MFMATDPHVVVELSHVLPPSGDNHSVVTLDREVLSVDVFYDVANQKDEGRIRIIFEEVASVVVSRVPGIDVTDIRFERPPSLDGVVEYRSSVGAANWTKARPWRSRKTRHFVLYLMEEGLLLHVFAADCHVSIESE